MTAQQYRIKREADLADAVCIDRELAQSPEPAAFKALASSSALRLVNALRSLGIIAGDGSMECQRSWLAVVITTLADIPA